MAHCEPTDCWSEPSAAANMKRVVRGLIERTDIVFSTVIETMLDVRRAIFDGYAKLHRVLLQVVRHGQILPAIDDRSRCRSRCNTFVQGRGR